MGRWCCPPPHGILEQLTRLECLFVGEFRASSFSHRGACTCRKCSALRGCHGHRRSIASRLRRCVVNVVLRSRLICMSFSFRALAPRLSCVLAPDSPRTRKCSSRFALRDRAQQSSPYIFLLHRTVNMQSHQCSVKLTFSIADSPSPLPIFSLSSVSSAR
ncbi:hypothetical protein FA95DRAFT_1305080 [Auriscalpium vulgare]|uniref:Uncharacterized protein n=1 Tax=Auriscalpium vulgare TaxID=40419 RepID=A0ACB8RRP2_9AGAM|nr:hypothetical protein FA95DRAFT_1305080 [Auriscalpium vulgare]